MITYLINRWHGNENNSVATMYRTESFAVYNKKKLQILHDPHVISCREVRYNDIVALGYAEVPAGARALEMVPSCARPIKCTWYKTLYS